MLKYEIADRWRPRPASGRRTWRRGEPTAAMRDDSGVIAIIVALSISTFLLGFAALAVDLGIAYERQTQLQSTADRLALAGAQGLPTVTTALQDLTNTLNGLCQSSQDFDTKDSPGMCPDPKNLTKIPTWMRDGDQSNGEVLFYQDTGQTTFFTDTNNDGKPDPTSGNQAEGIRVVLPPSKVTFGFAGAFTGGSTEVSKEATARVGTPLGAGILPIALTQNDVDQGQWCVKTGLPAGGTTTVPRNAGPWTLTPPNSQVTANTDGQTITYTVGVFGITRLAFHTDISGRTLTYTPKVSSANGTYTVTIPTAPPGTLAHVWATGTWSLSFLLHGSFTTTVADVDYSGLSAPNADPCTLGQGTAALARGYSKLARSSDNPGSDDLTSNIRTGPQVRLYQSGGLVGTVGTLLNCVSTVFSAASTCLSNQIGQTWAQDLTDGLFASAGNAPGRLDQGCSGSGTTSVAGQPGVQVDNSGLLSTPSKGTPLVDTTKVLPNQLFNDIIYHRTDGTDQSGWISSRALRCGRLAVMPVINPALIGGVIGGQGQSIVSFTYVWIDDLQDNGVPTGNRGVNWTNHQVSSLQGYVINPRYFAATVAGSLTVGPYLGANMPKEALLVHDLEAPDA